MIPKSGYRFSEKIMPHKTQSEMAIHLKPFRIGQEQWRRSAVHKKTGAGLERGTMAFRFRHIWIAALLAAVSPIAALAQGYPGYPYTIMTLDHRAVIDHRGAAMRHGNGAATATAPQHPSLLGREKFISKLHRRGIYAARGSSGSVLPTPLPRTQLIPPEGGGVLTTPSLAQEQGPTIIPGRMRAIPNLAHGPETFQDRASRCAFQSGLYGVPGTLRNQYMGACLQ